DDDLGTGTGTGNVIVNNVAPVITTASGTTINEGGTTTVSGAFTDPGTQDPHTVTLSWQDGSPDTVLILGAALLTFSTTPTYVDDNPSGTNSDVVGVQVTVTDDDLGTGTGTANVTVNNVAPTISTLTATPTAINENQSVTIDGTIADVGTLDTHSVTIDWEDGSTTFIDLGSSLTFSATHQYLDDTPTNTASDLVHVQVTVTDDDLGSTSATADVTANNVAPIITSFTATPTAVNEGQSVTVN